jgi:hypothetical protein
MRACNSEQLVMLLLRSLWSMFNVANRIRLAVFGSLCLKDTARRSVLLVRCLSYIAFSQLIHRMPNAFMQWYCLMMQIMVTAWMT